MLPTAMTEQDSRLDLRKMMVSLGHNESVYVTDGDGLFEVIGVRRRGVFVLVDCKDSNAEEIAVSAVTLALGYAVVTPAKSTTLT